MVQDAMAPASNLTSDPETPSDIFESLEHTLILYSERCLEALSTENEPNELHEGVKKSITARILGTENISKDSHVEENIVRTLNHLNTKFLGSITDPSTREKFETIRRIVSEKCPTSAIFEELTTVINDLKIEDEIPEEFLFSNTDESGNLQAVVTQPKGRGRPKRTQQQSVIVSLDDGVKRHLQNKSREVQFVFYSIVQRMFVNCASYLKSTRSRVLMNFNNPLIANLRSELTKSYSQRASRSKPGSQQASSEPSNKKQKLDKLADRLTPGPKFETSPLNSEQSRKLDLEILATLKEAHRCLEFISSKQNAFTKLWQRFVNSNNILKLRWFRRFSIDSKLMIGNHDEVSDLVRDILTDVEENTNRDDGSKSQPSSSTLTKASNSDVAEMRYLVEAISCNVQKSDKPETLATIEMLLARMKQHGLLDCDENYSNGDFIDEYMVIIHGSDDDSLGFLFFDTLSVVRYCMDILMSLIKLHATNTNLVSDCAIGHTIVLSQFDWPKEYLTYNECITWLRVHKPKSTTPQCLSDTTKFTYPDFFPFIRNPNIIEDFMAMLCQGYTLDIKDPNCPDGYIAQTGSQAARANAQSMSVSNSRSISSGSTSRTGKAITTRGVNKTFKEDLKVAMIAQMRASSVLIPLDMISEFMQTSLVPFLRCAKK